MASALGTVVFGLPAESWVRNRTASTYFAVHAPQSVRIPFE